MAGFRNVRDIVDAYDAGREFFSAWRKVPTVTTAAGYWIDLSLSPGNPSPNYYATAPLAAARLAQSTDGGIRHGGNVSPGRKVLRELLGWSSAANPMSALLCDYLLYYPFVPEDDPGNPQVMDNTTGLSRYTSGEGVQIMAVVRDAHSGAGSTFQCSYTNSEGVPGRLTYPATFGAQVVTGTILARNSGAGSFAPFLPLQDGDTGVRSIESCTILTGGDVGTFVLVLVKRLGILNFRGVDAAREIDPLKDHGLRLPAIEDDAFLGLVALTAGTIAGAQIYGTIQTTWSE